MPGAIGIVRLRERRGGRGHISYEITIPKELVELLGWRTGDKLLIELVEKDGRKAILVYKP
jgi:AbrB family looped-hinge helix DNA binding protein